MAAVEILFDPDEVVRAHDLVLEEGVHQVLPYEWPWLRWLRTQTDNPHLFVYLNLESGNFVLSHWSTPPGEKSWCSCAELETFSDSPSRLWPSDLLPPKVMLQRLAPAREVEAAKKQRRAEAEYAKREARAQGLTERKDVTAFLRRRGMEAEAKAIESGASSWVPSSMVDEDHRAATVDALMSARRTA